MTVRATSIVGSCIIDYSDLENLQWSSYLKLAKTSKRMCWPAGTSGMRIGLTIRPIRPQRWPSDRPAASGKVG